MYWGGVLLPWYLKKPETQGTIISHLLTRNDQSVEHWMWVVLFTVSLSRDIIPKANSCQRDETEI